MPSVANIERAYAPSDLSSYSFLERVMIRVVGLALYAVMKLLGSTVKFEVEGWETWKQQRPAANCLSTPPGTMAFSSQHISGGTEGSSS